MPHPDLAKIKAKLEDELKRLGITREQVNALALLMDDEAWAEQWQKDDWPHARRARSSAVGAMDTDGLYPESMRPD